MNRRTFAAGAILLAAVPLIAAWAGGWATITVENLPDRLIANQPTNLTFSLRQHGMKLLSEQTPIVHARSGDVDYKARALETNRRGYYTATLNLPSTGDWTITIRSGFGRSNVTLLPIAAVAAGSPTPVSLPAAERGRRLFVAKGCVACHAHARVPDSGTYEIAPDLTNRGLERGYLARFLADPDVKTSWSSNLRMPDLDLDEAEIAALVTFLSTEVQRPAKAAN